MDMREAFDKWLPGKVIECNKYLASTPDGFFTVWKAACEWQKQQDAELVSSDPWSEAQILNQNK